MINITHFTHPLEKMGEYLSHRAQMKADEEKRKQVEAEQKLKKEPWRKFKTRQVFSIDGVSGRLYFLFLFQENELNLMVNELDENKKPKSQTWIRLPIANIKDCQVH